VLGNTTLISQTVACTGLLPCLVSLYRARAAWLSVFTGLNSASVKALGHAVAQLIEALRYMLECRWFDSR